MASSLPRASAAAGGRVDMPLTCMVYTCVVYVLVCAAGKGEQAVVMDEVRLRERRQDASLVSP